MAVVPACFAQAQDTTSSTVSIKSPPQAKNLQAVQVTAEKKTESEQDVPISMSVIEGSDMLDNGVSRLADYYATVPGLSMNDRGAGRTTLVIRGISAGSELNPTVGINLDDAPFGSSTTDFSIADLDPFDIDHIEVLRGPQGTLYGASSMGGLIKFSMVQPDTESFSGRYQTDVSSTAHGGVNLADRVAVNLPLIKDKLALRVSLFKRHDAGYVSDPSQDKHDVNAGGASGGRMSLLWNVNDRFKVRASAMAQNSYNDATARIDVANNSYVPLYGAYAHERLPGTDSDYIKTRLYTVQMDGQFGWADFHSITSYNQYNLEGPQDVTGTFGAYTAPVYGVSGLGVKLVNDNRTGKFSQEFRFSSPDDGRALSWLGGLYFTKEHTSTYQDVEAVDRTTGADLGYGSMYSGLSPSTYKEVAAFGNVTYQFTDAFDVQLGGRFSSIRQSFTNDYSGPLNGGYSSDHETASNNVWTYSLSPRYHFSSDLMAYARVATGYRAGGANALLSEDKGNFPTQYKSDSLTSYELGLKGDFADHKLSLDTALFYINWADLQLAETSQETGSSYYVNAGKAKSEGAEATLSWRPVRGLTLSGNTSYTHAVLTRDTPDGTYGLAGDRLPYSPTWSGNLSASYTFGLTNQLDGEVGGSATYVGDRMSSFVSSASAQRFMLRAYTTLELHAGIQAMDWNINLYVRNLTDARGFLSATAQNATTGVSSYGLLIIQPRTVGISATYSF
ncbi:TonB-dependent receptor [Frateuria aurantia]